MVEVTDHPARKYLETLREGGVVVEYAVMRNNTGEHGLPEHREAADFAMCCISERQEEHARRTMHKHPHLRYEQFTHYRWDAALAAAVPYPSEKFLARPDDPYYIDKPKVTSRAIDPEDGKYACAFLEPPYGNKFVVKDWERLNSLLFSSPGNLEIYKWTDNWSNYFDDGKEWWGTFFWTVYDRGHGYFVAVAASSTD